jgi:hypothetical protein
LACLLPLGMVEIDKRIEIRLVTAAGTGQKDLVADDHNRDEWPDVGRSEGPPRTTALANRRMEDRRWCRPLRTVTSNAAIC